MATSARLEELQQKFRDNPRRYFAPLANEHRKLGELEQAITLCRTHLPQQPHHVSGHIVLGQALFDAGDVSDARATFEQALDLDPENLIALRFLGDIARAQGEHLTARQWYERVLEADPRNDEIAKLIRDMQQSDATPVVAPPSADELMDAEQESDDGSLASVPNDTETETSAVAELEAAQPIEDLATAWQHEVAALDEAGPVLSFDAQQEDVERASMFADAAEPELELETEFEIQMESEPESGNESERASEQAAVSALEPELELPATEPAEATAPDSPPAQEPTEPWLEPDEQFVSTLPAPEPPAFPAPPPFVEIDYSMFEAVADEEQVSAAMPPEGVSAQPDAESFEHAELFEPPAPTTDDWFATPNLQDTEVAANEIPSEAAFDLDAAFQDVLPNAQELALPADADAKETPEELPAFADEPAAVNTGEWLSAERETARADEGVFSMPVDSGDNVDDAFAMTVESGDNVDDAFAMTADSGDNVDDAFAELDRLTASLESDVAGSAMLLPDEEYVSADATPQQPELLIGRTPDMGVPVVEETPSAFVTETMAELYLQQGFREEALAVYRQLVAMNPDDTVLIGRVAALEGAPMPVGGSATDRDLEELRQAPPQRADAAGQSVRSFLGVFARRRAPMRRRERVAPQEAAPPRDSALAALFGSPQHADESSAAVLAAAFAVPNVDMESLPGRPTRAAPAELSLGDVFGGGAATNAANAASFDEFFSTGSTDSAKQSPLDEEGSDMVQFTAWLEGLKKK
jgi:tetratricopeptide (TPR) repeat protein